MQPSPMLRWILSAALVNARAADPCAEGKLEYAGLVDGALYFKWTGQIANKMDVKLFESFSEHQDKAREVSDQRWATETSPLH